MRLNGHASRDYARVRSATRQRATTLIELLVVMSVITLLIAVLIPSLKRSMKMARTTVCMHNMREIGHALRMYRVENEGWLPSAGRSPGGIQALGLSKPWFCQLFPTYLDDPLILTCPEDPYRYRMLKVSGQPCDSDVVKCSSYGINRFIITARSGALAHIDRRGPARPLDTILLGDLGPDEAYSDSEANPETRRPDWLPVPGPIRTGEMSWDDGNPLNPERPRPWLTTRHGRGINIFTTADAVRKANTAIVMRRRMDRYYENCAAGGCTFCNDLHLDHYSFAKDRLFWWTGPTPAD